MQLISKQLKYCYHYQKIVVKSSWMLHKNKRAHRITIGFINCACVSCFFIRKTLHKGVSWQKECKRKCNVQGQNHTRSILVKYYLENDIFFLRGGVAYKNKLSLGCVNRWQMLCFPKTQTGARVIKEKVSHESGLIKLISSSILLFLDSARVALHATVKRDHSLSHIEPWCGTSVQPWAILVIHPLKPFKPAVSWLAAEITTLRKIYFTAYRSKSTKNSVHDSM